MLAYFSYGTELEVTAGPLSDIYAVNLSLTGHAEVRYRGAEIGTSRSTAVVFSVLDGSSMRWSADHTVLCVTIRRPALEQHLGGWCRTADASVGSARWVGHAASYAGRVRAWMWFS